MIGARILTCNMEKSKLISIWYLVGGILAVVALLAGLYAGNLQQNPPLPELKSATVYPADFRPIKAFELHNQLEQSFTLENLKNQWSLMFFGFTHCPDVCPNTLYTLKQIHTQLAQRSEPIQVIMVSVDPERDQTDKLKDYVTYFDPSFIGITGNDTEIKALSSSLGVFYQLPEDREGNYLVEHSAGIFLINPQAQPHALFSAPHQAQQISQDIVSLLDHY